MACDKLMEQYELKTDIERKFKETENEEEKKELIAAYKKLSEKIDAEGEEYKAVYTRYCDAMERGNEYIDIDNNFNFGSGASHVSQMIDAFRKYGIEKFTFSSGWSDAMETAWQFEKNGCRAIGMMEINSMHKLFGSDEHEKKPALVFEV